ncbi:hypothetical protein ACN38_g6413, partial [Penicillium nordicum]
MFLPPPTVEKSTFHCNEEHFTDNFHSSKNHFRVDVPFLN